MLNPRLPTAFEPFSLKALPTMLPSAILASQWRDLGSERVRKRSSTNQKCVRKICATIGSAEATSMTVENN